MKPAQAGFSVGAKRCNATHNNGGMAVHHTIAKAVIHSAISEHMPFVLTPKYPESQGECHSLHSFR